MYKAAAGCQEEHKDEVARKIEEVLEELHVWRISGQRGVEWVLDIVIGSVSEGGDGE